MKSEKGEVRILVLVLGCGGINDKVGVRQAIVRKVFIELMSNNMLFHLFVCHFLPCVHVEGCPAYYGYFFQF